MTSIGEEMPFAGGRLGTRPAAMLSGLWIALAALGLIMALRAILAATVNLAEDEAYYWLWSRHLALGYYDHPPMVAYWIRAGTALFGQTEFGVRFIGLLSAVLASYLFFRASVILFRDLGTALLCVIWLNVTLLCNAAAILATPDTPLALFSVFAIFGLAKLIETANGLWWLAIGAALGLAFMSKYTAVLLLPGLFLWMAASAGNRRWFIRPEPYIGALAAFIIIAPVVYWNYSHDWVSFAKQAQHGIKDKPSSALLSVAEFLAGQAGLATPLIFIFCVFGSFYCAFIGLRQNNSRLLAVGSLPAVGFAFFLAHAASQKIQPNWPGFLYPAAILAGVHGFLIFSRQRRTASLPRGAFRFAPWAGAAFVLAAFSQLGLGLLPIDAKRDPTSRLKGWAGLGSELSGLQRETGAARILTDRYAITGELAFYSPNPDSVMQIDERIRYQGFPLPKESELANAPALLVLRAGGDASKAERFFSGRRYLTTIRREAGRHPRDAYDVHLLTGYLGGLFDREGEACALASNRDLGCKQKQ